MDDAMLEKELQELAGKKNARIHEILPDEIVVSEWVRWKCQFGCKGYAKHLSCPPYVPGPDRTRKLLKDYMKAISCISRGYLAWSTSIRTRYPKTGIRFYRH